MGTDYSEEPKLQMISLGHHFLEFPLAQDIGRLTVLVGYRDTVPLM